MFVSVFSISPLDPPIAAPSRDCSRVGAWPVGWLLVMCCLSTTLVWPARADVDGLAVCREQRHATPSQALPACERATLVLIETGRHDDAFEAWMHAAELASQLGDGDRAQRALDQATTLLPSVGDTLAAHRLARRRGLNAYREGDPLQALARFLEALAIARSSGDKGAWAISENDLGVTYRHLGNYTQALGHFEASLGLREALDHDDLGALMANIGTLYLELGDLERSESYLTRALNDHRAGGRSLPAHRTLEDLGVLAWRRDDHDAARDLFDQAWEYYADAGAVPDQSRLALTRADLETSVGRNDTVRDWLARARALAGAGAQRDLSLRIAVIEASIAQGPAAQSAAYEALRTTLEEAAGASPELVVRAQGKLADLAQSLGRLDSAIVHLRAFHDKEAALTSARHGERFDALRVRFDVARLEADHERLAAASAQQDAELARRRTQTVLVAAIALLALAFLAIYSQSRLYRQRTRAQAERRELEQRIAEVRRAAEFLRSDVRSLTSLLDQREDADLLFDASGRIRAVTASASQLLGREADALQHVSLSKVLPAEIAQWAQALVESASLAGVSEHEVLGERQLDEPLQDHVLQCRRLALEEEVGVLTFVQVTRDGAVDDEATTLEATSVSPRQDDADERVAFRQLLVDLMRASLDAWERVTRKTRIDLAEASGVWRVTIDDGRLRVRAMDRYLSLDALPDRPRWREVLRTAYYVLAEVPLTPDQRSQLDTLVEQVLRSVRGNA